MSVVWHSSLTAAESKKIENVQKTSLKIILADRYSDYQSGLDLAQLETLSARRTARCLAFAKRCLKNDQTKHFFPLNPDALHDLRNPEKYIVNFAHTENYRNSAVPYCQRLLNADFQLEEERRRQKEEEEEERRREKERTRHQGRQGTGARREGD